MRSRGLRGNRTFILTNSTFKGFKGLVHRKSNCIIGSYCSVTSLWPGLSVCRAVGLTFACLFFLFFLFMQSLSPTVIGRTVCPLPKCVSSGPLCVLSWLLCVFSPNVCPQAHCVSSDPLCIISPTVFPQPHSVSSAPLCVLSLTVCPQLSTVCPQPHCWRKKKFLWSHLYDYLSLLSIH